MPPRRRSQFASLTADDLAGLATAVAEGRRATVYLREGVPGLNLAPGSSARVLSVSGSTVMVKPSGVDDELPYEADELRMTKNPPPAPAKRAAAKRAPAKRTAVQQDSPRSATPRKPPAATTEPATSRVVTPPTTPSTPPKPAATPKRTPAKKLTKSVAVTVYGSADNEWFVSVTRDVRKPQRSRAVSPEAVDAAVHALGDTAARDAVTSVITAAREEAKRRVAELSRELEQARQALAALDAAD